MWTVCSTRSAPPYRMRHRSADAVCFPSSDRLWELAANGPLGTLCSPNPLPNTFAVAAAALLQAGEPVGVALAAVVGLLLAPIVGWRWVFLLSSLSACVVIPAPFT